MPRAYKSFPRVFVAPPLTAGASVELDRDPANHLINVLRLNEGDSVVAFNGRDGAWLSRIASAGKKGATLETIVQPVLTEFPQVRKLRTDKLDAWVLEAAQQCEVLTVPRVADEIELKPLIA